MQENPNDEGGCRHPSSPWPWYDYQVCQEEIPDAVTHLRIGFIEYQQLLQSNAPTPTPVDLPEGAFRLHQNLRNVQIYLPVVSRILDHVFQECQKLEQVEFLMKSPGEDGEEEHKEDNDDNTILASKLISIGYNAFAYCQNLHSVIGLERAAESLQKIGEGAFRGENSLANVDFLASLTSLHLLGRCAFQHGKLTTVDLSRAVLLTELQGYTFFNCRSLISIQLPRNLLGIGEHVFYECSSVEYIKLPLTLRNIDSAAFYYCRKLKSIVLPSSLQQIGQGCFWGCSRLTCVVLPSTRMPFLKCGPFNHGCKSLSSLELPDPVPRQQWPLILEQFCNKNGIDTSSGGIPDSKNLNTIVWNFLCRNMSQLFIEDNAEMSRRRPAPAPSS